MNRFGFSNEAVKNVLDEDDNSTIGNILRFLSRPGYAFRSALSGDFDDSLENVAQFLLDLPTGGFIDRRLSLANVLPDSVQRAGDITDDKERPEFTDLLERWGGASPASRGFWGNLALDVGGGVLTDPLTLLTGPTRSIAGKALAGQTRVTGQRLLADTIRANAPDALRSASDEILREVSTRAPRKVAEASGEVALRPVVGEVLQSGGTAPIRPFMPTRIPFAARQISPEVPAGFDFDEFSKAVKGYQHSDLEKHAFTSTSGANQNLQQVIHRNARNVNQFKSAQDMERYFALKNTLLDPAADAASRAAARDALRAMLPEIGTRMDPSMRDTLRKPVEHFLNVFDKHLKPGSPAKTVSQADVEALRSRVAARMGAEFDPAVPSAPSSNPGIVVRSMNMVPEATGSFDPVMQQTALGRTLQQGGLSTLSPKRQAMVQRGLEGRAAEKILGRRLGPSDAMASQARGLREFLDAAVPNAAEEVDAVTRLRNASAEFQQTFSREVEELDAGLARLREAGTIGKGTGVRLQIPFGPTIAEAPDAWKHLGTYGTLPGLVKKGLSLHDRTKPIADTMDFAADKGWDFLVGFYDKTLKGKVPQAMKYFTQEAGARQVSRDRRVDRVAIEIFGGLNPEQQTALGETLARYEDEFARDMFTAQAATPEELVSSKYAYPDADDMLARFRQEVRDQGLPISDRQLDQFLGEFKQVEKDLIRHGIFKDLSRKVPEGLRPDVWKKIATNPFYIPHQLNPLFNELLGEGMKNKALKDAVADVFSKRRNYRTSEEFATELERIANVYGVRVDGIADLQDLNVVNLFRQRMFSHNKTLWRAELVDKARRLGMASENPAEDYLAEYLKTQLTPTARDDMNPATFAGVSKILGGGKFRVNADGSERLQAWAKRAPKDSFVARRLRTDRVSGKKWVEIDWPGLNFLWKPWLTTAAGPAYHFRNTASAVVMGGFDEDIGWQAGGRSAKALFHTMMNSPFVKRFADMGYKPDQIADAVQLLKQDPAVRAAALQRLEASGAKVGNYTWSEVATILDAAVPERVNMNELDQAIGRIDVFGRELDQTWKQALRGENAPALKGVLQKWVKFGQDMANSVEQHFRAGAMLELLGQGMDAQTAINKVNRAFVNYNTQNLTERFLRDVIPFLRFTIGSTPWLQSIAQRPRLVNWLGRVQGSAENMNEDIGGIPTRAQGTLALPLPWKDANGNAMFLTSLGLPQEVALNVLGLPTPEGFRKGVLGGLQPLIRFPLEASVGKTFFFGEDFGNFRRAPVWLPDFLTREVTLPDGTVRHEVPGEVNEIINALPTSRLESVMARLVDTERPFWNKALQTLTGARTITVDAEKELTSQLTAYLKKKAQSGEVGETLIYFSRLSEEDMPQDLKLVLAEMSRIKSEKRKAKRAGFAFRE